jgi:hypothetical protein
MVLLEDNKVLHLLPGIPRQWMEAGKRVKVDHGVTIAAKVNLQVDSRVDREEIAVALELSDVRPREIAIIRLRVPHPSRQKIKSVLVNGKSWTRVQRERETIELDPQPGLTSIVVNY